MFGLGDRMKLFEDAHRIHLPPRMPIIIRVDGKAFHTLTRGCNKPFDDGIASAIDAAAIKLLEVVQTSRMAFAQSDEISLLLINYNRQDSEPWFDNNLQKMVSVSAAAASVGFTAAWSEPALFDSRAFVLTPQEVANYFLWRQQDSTRNSIHMVARSLYSHNQLVGKNVSEMQEMIFQKGINWNDYEPYWKRGRVITKEGVDRNIPIFSEDRQYIEKFLVVEEP